MKFGQLFGYYFVWHYGPAFSDIFGIWKNFLWFLYNFFSIPLLLKTLFSPFERLHDSYEGDFNPKEFFASFTVNVIMRIVGAVLRLFVILIGVVFFVASLLAGILFFALWVVLPALVPIFFFSGLAALFL